MPCMIHIQELARRLHTCSSPLSVRFTLRISRTPHLHGDRTSTSVTVSSKGQRPHLCWDQSRLRLEPWEAPTNALAAVAIPDPSHPGLQDAGPPRQAQLIDHVARQPRPAPASCLQATGPGLEWLAGEAARAAGAGDGRPRGLRCSPAPPGQRPGSAGGLPTSSSHGGPSRLQRPAPSAPPAPAPARRRCC